MAALGRLPAGDADLPGVAVWESGGTSLAVGLDELAGCRLASPSSPMRLQGPGRAGSKSYPKLSYFNEVDKGGHFAYWEEPDLFAGDIRAAFGSLRR